jgi:hypothetical protein
MRFGSAGGIAYFSFLVLLFADFVDSNIAVTSVKQSLSEAADYSSTDITFVVSIYFTINSK